MRKGTFMIIQTYLELENEIKKYNRIAIFGAGEWGKIYTYSILRNAAFRAGKKVDCFYDNLVAPGTLVKDDVAVHPIEELYEQNTDLLLFVGVGAKLREKISAQIEESHVAHFIVADEIFFTQICQSIEIAGGSVRDEYGSLMDDGIFLKAVYEHNMGAPLDLKNPQSFNEKLNWLKIYDHNPLYTVLADKYSVKEYVASIIGWEYIIPTLGIYNCWEEINFDSLPEQFVLKCTHDAGSTILVKDKDRFDRREAQHVIEKCLKRNFYWIGREWPYKNIPPRIIAEQFIESDSDKKDLIDYKFFCFNGVADNVMIVTDRATKEPRFYHFSKDWHLLKYNRRGRALPDDYTMFKPDNMSQMFELVEQMSIGFPEVRIDLYNVNGKIYFGEYTLFNEGGFENGFDYKSDKHLGDLIELPVIK